MSRLILDAHSMVYLKWQKTLKLQCPIYLSSLEGHVQELIKEGYSTGLAQALSENAATYDFRFWVVDNSGSMQIGDGHRFVSTTKKGGVKAVACTRWEELQGTVKYHAKMAALLDSPTIFQVRKKILGRK